MSNAAAPGIEKIGRQVSTRPKVCAAGSLKFVIPVKAEDRRLEGGLVFLVFLVFKHFRFGAAKGRRCFDNRG